MQKDTFVPPATTTLSPSVYLHHLHPHVPLIRHVMSQSHSYVINHPLPRPQVSANPLTPRRFFVPFSYSSFLVQNSLLLCKLNTTTFTKTPAGCPPKPGFFLRRTSRRTTETTIVNGRRKIGRYPVEEEETRQLWNSLLRYRRTVPRVVCTRL